MGRPKKEKGPDVELGPSTTTDPAALAREYARKVATEKFKESGGIITADHLDDNLRFLTVPDLLMQIQLGRPGYAMGRIQTIIGFEGVSKSSKMYWQGGLAVRAGGLFHIVSLEKADSTEHIKHYVDPEQVVIWPARTLEEGIEMSYEIQRIFKQVDPKGLLPKVQGLDSVAGSTMEALLEEEQEAGAKMPGGIGKIMADFVNVMKEKIVDTQTFWSAINQARDKQAIGKIEAMALQWAPQIEKLCAKGGRALPFHSTYFEVLEQTGRVKDAEKIIQGLGIRCTWKKNKLGRPFGTVEYDMVYGQSFDFSENTVDTIAMSGACGLKVKEKRYWSEELGVTKPVKYPEMYEIMHQPENREKFLKYFNVVPGVEMKPLSDYAPPPPPPPAPIQESIVVSSPPIALTECPFEEDSNIPVIIPGPTLEPTIV